MDKLIIRGGNRLSGTIPISGAKNAALTLIPCALLTEEAVTLRNLPRLADIDGFQHLMTQFGVSHTIPGKRPDEFGRNVTLGYLYGGSVATAGAFAGLNIVYDTSIFLTNEYVWDILRPERAP